MHPLLKLALAALAFSMVVATPLETRRQKRFSWSDFKGAVANFSSSAVDNVKGWFSDDDKATEKAKADAIATGQEMINRGRHLLELATNLSLKAYDEVTDPENREKLEAAIESMKESASDVIAAGQTIVDNSDNIKAAVKETYAELSAATEESLEEIKESLRLTKESMVEAGPVLAAAGLSARDSAVALYAAMQEMVETSSLIAKANDSLEIVGKNLWGFAESVVDAGKSIGKTIGDGAKKIAKASGLWEDSESE